MATAPNVRRILQPKWRRSVLAMIGRSLSNCLPHRSVVMPRKSVYFPDEQWPRIERAAELEDRSVSKWIQRAVERELSASQEQAIKQQREAMGR
jgi:hypothetical protein